MVWEETIESNKALIERMKMKISENEKVKITEPIESAFVYQDDA